MQTKAALMVLVLLSGTIAGCTGDPDGGGNDGIDSDALDDLFDQYFEDFVNNTTITVNNHYYNNTTYVVDDGDYSTTVVNEYNNTTINEGDETSTSNYNNQTENDYSALNYTWGSSGNGSGSMVQVFRITWNPDEHVSPTDFGTRQIVINGTVQVPGWSGSELSYQYNGYLIKLSLTCEELISAADWMNYEGWRDWIFDEYGGSWSQAENVGISIQNDIQQIYGSNPGARDFCWSIGSSPPLAYNDDETYWNHEEEWFYHRVFEIPILAGQAVELLSIPYLRNVTLECDDGFSTTTSNGSFSDYAFAGGHTDCIISGHATIETAYSYVRTEVWNGSGSSIQTPDWFNGAYWYAYTNLDNTSSWQSYPYSNTPTDFLVYFTMYFVQVYEHDSE